MNHIRHPLWNQGTQNLLKVIGYFAGRTEFDGGKYMDSQGYNAWDDEFIVKHSAELNDSGFIILPNLTYCEKLKNIDIYSHCIGFGLKTSAQVWFGAVQETFTRASCLSKEDGRAYGALLSPRICPA